MSTAPGSRCTSLSNVSPHGEWIDEDCNERRMYICFQLASTCKLTMHNFFCKLHNTCVFVFWFARSSCVRACVCVCVFVCVCARARTL
jgi:hypothetical protein